MIDRGRREFLPSYMIFLCRKVAIVMSDDRFFFSVGNGLRTVITSLTDHFVVFN